MSYSNPMHHAPGARNPNPPALNRKAELQARIAQLRKRLAP